MVLAGQASKLLLNNMKKATTTLLFILIAALSCISQVSLSTITFTYGLDTFHTSGGALRTDSLFLVETVSGTLVSQGTVADIGGTGTRKQTLSSPIFLTDTAQLTQLVERYLQDSTSLQEKIDALRTQMELLGAKARAIEQVRDSVIYGAFLYDLENIWEFQPDQPDIRTGQVDQAPSVSMASTGSFGIFGLLCWALFFMLPGRSRP